MSSSDNPGETLVPVVSVILPVNRDDGFLFQAIESVLHQTLRDLELIIVANRCSDEVWSALGQIGDPRVRLLRSDIGQLPFNLNLGIEHARGSYIARMDADDIAHPERLEIQRRYLDEHPDVAAVGSWYEHIDEQGRRRGMPAPLPLTPEAVRRRLPFESCLPHPTVMARKSALLAVGGYAYGLFAEDWDLWLRLSRAGYRLANIDQVLLSYRIHSNQSTGLRSLRRNIGNVLALHVREFVIQGRPVFFLGAFYYVGSTLLRALISWLRNRLL
nr:MAG: glycosyl transferase [Pseudomonadota bacterium]